MPLKAKFLGPQGAKFPLKGEAEIKIPKSISKTGFPWGGKFVFPPPQISPKNNTKARKTKKSGKRPGGGPPKGEEKLKPPKFKFLGFVPPPLPPPPFFPRPRGKKHPGVPGGAPPLFVFY